MGTYFEVIAAKDSTLLLLRNYRDLVNKAAELGLGIRRRRRHITPHPCYP
jgi:hypothetical protein